METEVDNEKLHEDLPPPPSSPSIENDLDKSRSFDNSEDMGGSPPLIGTFFFSIKSINY